MNNIVTLPFLIPLLTGVFLIFFSKHAVIQRWISALSALLLVGTSLYLVQAVFENGTKVLEFGGWKAPFGIVFVADMLSVLLVATTSVLSLACLFYAFHSIGEGRERYYFYSFYQFLITGVIGAFLTGDIFNLFVFFEVLLMASYALIVLGGTKIQLRESIKYILVNIVSSALFVIAVAYLYAVTGTLNMADLSVRVAEVNQSGLLTVIAILFLVVFGMKAALFPLFFWLPGSYQAPPTAVSAIFAALLTKVGIYSIFRTFSIIFYHDPSFTHQIMVVLAALTMIFGAIGAVAYNDVKKIIVYNVIVAVGFIIFGIASFSEVAYSGAIYYLIHDMVAKGALFLLGGTLIAVAGTSNLKEMGGVIKNHPLLGWMFFVVALALVGVPPLSGFFGKLLLIQGGFSSEHYLVVGLMLFSSLLVLYSMMKIFLNGFFGQVRPTKLQRTPIGILYPPIILIVVSIGLGLGVEFVYPYVQEAAQNLMDPAVYIDAVLKE